LTNDKVEKPVYLYSNARLFAGSEDLSPNVEENDESEDDMYLPEEDESDEEISEDVMKMMEAMDL
jgi:hypothetical protein